MKTTDNMETKSKVLKKTWFTRPSKACPGRWLLLRRLPAEFGGTGFECIKTYSGNWAQMRARMEAKSRNEQGI